MGTVYLAIDPLIEREVAIKVLPLAGADEYSDRLIAEARVSGRLIHPNIVGVFDVGEEQGQPFVVMPYVQGRTVAAILTAPERPSIATKLRWMAQLCDALAYAHERRVIHRDIKPTNLLIDEQHNLRVLDFGIAKVLTTSQIQFTSVGTPAYMAPEQYSSDPVDPRTDIFAAGLVLYELITHRRALSGTTPAQIYGQLMAGPPPRVLDAAPDTDPLLAAVCERAMSRHPKDRFQTAGALGDALAEVGRRWSGDTRGVTTVPSEPPAAPASAPDAAPTVATRIDGAPPGGERHMFAPLAAPVASILLEASGPQPVSRPIRWWHVVVPLVVIASIVTAVVAMTSWSSPASPVPAPGVDTRAALGAKAFADLGCVPCHSDDAERRGPSLRGVFGSQVTLATGQKVTADEAYIRESILTPTAKMVAGYPPVMPSYEGVVSEEQTVRLTAYVKSLTAAGSLATPGAPVVGRLHVSSDLEGTTFTTTPVLGRGVIVLSTSAPNVLSPARYEVRAVYTDRDPVMGDGNKPTTARQTVDIVAGQTATVRFALEGTLWRHRFERALARPAGGGRTALLDRTYRRLKELGAATSADNARYATAASQQQLVRFVRGDITTDSGGFERFVKYTRVDIVRIDAAAQRIAMLDGPSSSRELASGRHDYEVIVEIQYSSRPQSMTCTGAFEVAGGPAALELKVDAIVRRPTMQDHRLAAQCQIGGTTPFVPSTGSDPAAGLATLTIRVQSKGQPVPGATITIGAMFNPSLPSQVSDADGTATFNGLRTGDYRVSAGRAGYRGVGILVNVAATTNVHTMQLDAWLAQTTTDESGRFRIPVNPGRFDVQVIPPGRHAMTWFEGVSVTTSRGASLDATIRDASGPTVDRLKAVGSDDGAVISGQFRDARGAPLKGVTINVYPGRGNITVPAR